jgi:hypothetical protein
MKKYFLGILAIVLALSFSAFTVKTDRRVNSGEKWFKFNGVDPTDLGNASKYSIDEDGSSPTVCTDAVDMYRCEISAVPQTGNTSLPNLSTINDETKRATP